MKSIDNTQITLGTSLTYNGSEQTQAFTIKDGEVELKEDVDFEVSGNKQTLAGNYKLVINGIGDYKGTKQVEYTIAKADPTVTDIPKAKGYIGQTLKNVAPPTVSNGSLSWKDDSQSLGTEVKEIVFVATFTPSDTTNYNSIEVDVTVQVKDPSKTDTAGKATAATSAGVSYNIEVKGFTTKSSSAAVADAYVEFDESDVLNVTLPNSSEDSKDIKVGVRDADSKQTPGISVKVFKSTGELINQGVTASAYNYERGESKGEFKTHNGVTDASFVEGKCECTAVPVTTHSCSVCAYEISRDTGKAAGHPDTQLTQYGTDSAAQICGKCNHVIFGHFEQDGDAATTDEIEWLALDDVKADGTQLLISLNGLVERQFNSENGNTWENVEVRKWLNSSDSTITDGFYTTAFTESERLKIATTTNETKSFDGNTTVCTTQDNVFLLSKEEAASYFADDASRVCWPSKSCASWSPSQGEGCIWWLRSPGEYEWNAILVGQTGWINTETGGDSIYTEHYVVRPAINFKIK